MDLYINRFYMLHQRLRRKKGWYKPAIMDGSSECYIEVQTQKLLLVILY